MADATALVLFTAMRGFTGWSDVPEVFAHQNEFVTDFLQLIRKHFPSPALVKGLGDGAMIVQEIDPTTSSASHASLLTRTLKTITKVDNEFGELCERFAQGVGHKTPLRLGWGIVRGPIKKLDQDYVGSNINKAARLCDAARPFGIVIDRADFTAEPAFGSLRFFPQTRILSGLDDVDVWVTAEIESQFVARERLRQNPEVHVAGLCIDARNKRSLRLLLATRAKTRHLYPNLIEGCGGQLARSESFVGGVVRHFRLEMGIEVRVLPAIHCFYEIKEPDQPLIPGLRFLCERVGDAEPRSSNHSKIE